tara:strand:+ start:42437 stop:50962 length:8526 start_codon:yes stop_codon:yes gene_type:complete
MLPKKSRHSWYLFVLLVFSLIITSVMANTKVYDFIDATSIALIKSINSIDKTTTVVKSTTLKKPIKARENLIEAPLYFATIISNADEEVFCTNDGATLARFNLCGNFDNRIITLDQAYSTYEWQQLTTGSCSLYDVDLNCPTYTCGGLWTTVGTSSSFALNANSISAATGAEFRVRVNGGSYYYIKIKKSTISQTYVKRDYICGVPGRVQVTNLSSSYEYAIDNGSGFGAWQGAIFDGLLPGTYIVKARLKNTPNTCEYPYEPIVIESKEIDIDVTVVDAQCFGENGSIAVKVNDVPGPYKYTLLDSNGFPQEFTSFIASDTYNFAAVGFGTYSVQVETQQCKGDPGNGISAPRQDVDINGNALVIGDGLIALAASTEVNSSFGCSDITSVDIIVRTSGGSAPYTFTVNGGSTSSPSYTGQTIYTVTASGDYNFLITDGNGCTITASANIKELSPPVVSASGVNGTCTNGGAKINFNVTNARGYNLSYRTQSSDSWVTTPQISVADGTYNSLEVRYEQGGFSCTMILPPVTVTSEATVNGTVTKLSDQTCDGFGSTNGGSIEFGSASGGSGSGFEFSVDGVNFLSTQLFTNLAPGTYTPIIRDNSGCRLELTAIVIDQVDPPTNIDFVQNNTNCALGTTDVQLTPTSNFAIANYSITSPVSIDNGSDATFIGLNTSTTYTFQIRDNNGCIYSESFTPVVISSIRARVKSGGDKRVCNGDTDGSGIFIIDGFGTNYTYQINSEPISAPQNTAEVNLVSRGAGTYTITATDVDTGCTDTAAIVIEESASFDLVPVVTPMTCANGNIGRVIAYTNGGWGGNRYTIEYPDGTIVGPTSNRTFGSLTIPSTPSTPYRVTVEDSEGCTATYEFQLTALSAPTITIASANLCYEPVSGASVTVAATGGASGYEYRINNGSYQASSTFLNLSPGTHTVEVRDSNDCTDVVSITINRQLRVSTTVETEIPCGGAPGQIRVNVSNGYLANATPKEFQVSSDNGTTWSSLQPFTANSFLYPVTTGGDYIFRVTDNESCEAFSARLEVKDPINILATAELIPASCGDTTSGGVRILPDATSGIPPFEIDFENTGTFTSQTVYTGLTAGQTYGYTVRDSRGCLTSGLSATIPTSPNAPPAADVTANDVVCSGPNLPPIAATGTIQINNVTDGTPDFTYIVLDNFGTEITRVGPTSSTSEIISHPNLVAGDYTVRTVDALGCSDIDTVTISQTNLTVVPDAISPSCNILGFSNTVEILGGVGPDFLIRLVGDPNDPVTPSSPPREHTFDGLQLGVTYTVEVTDLGTGCIYFQEIPPVEGPTSLDVTASSPPVFCDDLGNGRADFTVTGFTGPIDIDLIDPLTGTVIDTQTFTGVAPYDSFFDVAPGTYRILVTDSDTCTDATPVDVILDIPSIDIISNVPANCNALGQLTVRGSGGDGGPYTFAFVPAGDTPLATDFTADNTAVLPGSLTGISYDIWAMDGRGCTFNVRDDVVLLQPALPTPTVIVDNQCAASAASFSITATMPAWVDTPSFTLNGEQNFTGIFSVNTPGTYTIDVVDANGCSGSGTAIVYEFLSGTGEFTALPICNNPDGTITISTNGGSGDFTFELQDNLGNPIGGVPTNNSGIFTGQTPGEYLVLVTDNLVNDGTGFCFFSVPVNLDLAVPPIIDAEIVENISCNGANDGSITILLQGGTDVDGPIDYVLTNISTAATVSNTTGVFNNLVADDYQVEVITARNCRALSNIITISEPAIFEISATSTPFTCEIGANRFSSSVITVNIDQVGTVGSGYQYSITGFENYQTANTFEIIDDGTTQTITVYAIDANGCQDQFTLPAIAPPSEVQSTLMVQSLLNCEDPETVRISVVGTTDFTILTTSAIAVADVTNSGSNSYADVNLPAAGEYLFVVQDNVTGCLYPLPRHDVVAPINPIATIREAKPIQCFGDANGELFISVTDYTGVYDYTVYRSDDLTQTTPIATGTFDTANYPDISGDDARITGLPGGNFYVRVKAIGFPKCFDDSNVANIRTPNGPLTVPSVEIDNVSCDDSSGKIVATGIGGWDSSPYDYRLLLEDTAGTISIGSVLYTEVVTYGFTNEFEGLSSGNYRVEIRDIGLCENYFDITLAPIDPIVAGIREPQGLVCPDGNNAILEAYDPTTGDSITAISGASGGVAGSGYKYQLLYLNSNDNTDVNSRSGLQDTPTFDGVSSGFISAGWYAIEVSSSHKCIGITAPYYVVPPPPIDPKLVQVRAPGCGGQGQMRLSIENPESGFSYEYRSSTAAATDPFLPITGTSVLIDGDQGFYQYDVRKVGGAGACGSLPSEGITLVDAQAIDLVANLPDDISCATENDGRIESFASGGVGDEMYTLYLGNPTPASSSYTAFNPDPSATVVRAPQEDGTFEGLQEGTYYIAVTSGITCGDVEGPLVITRPEAIVYTITTTNITCNGETDGSITIEVLSGGEGLLQFAINPNYNEFFSDADNPGVYTFDNLAAGTDYEILIQDEQGCGELVMVVPITEPDVLSISEVVTQPEICLNAYDGEAQLTISGGTPFIDPVTFATYYETRVEGSGYPVTDPSDPTEGYLRNDDLLFSNLQGGESYRIFVRDMNGCTDDSTINVGLGVNLESVAIPQYGCEGIFPNSTVTIEMTDDSLVPDLLFNLDIEDINTASATRTFGDLPAGEHIVYIYHSNGCMNQVTFTIDEYMPLSLTVNKTGPDEITAVAEGGYGNYLYSFQGLSPVSSNTFNLTMDANVVVQVVDEKGCIAMVTMPFDFDSMVEFPNFFTPNGDVMGDTWAPKNSEYFPYIDVKIYDRYGRVVAVLDQIRAWDGTYEGDELPTGDYWYVVNANDKDKQQYVGHFTLYR